MYACICKGIAEGAVRRAGRQGILSATELVEHFGLNDARCCGRCARNPGQFVELALDGAASARSALTLFKEHIARAALAG